MAEEVVRGLPGITPGFQCEKVSGEHLPPPATKVGGRQQRFRDSACQCGRMASRERGGKRDTKKAPLLAGPGKGIPSKGARNYPNFSYRWLRCGNTVAENWRGWPGRPQRTLGCPCGQPSCSNDSI
jgi:hypothetical protein